MNEKYKEYLLSPTWAEIKLDLINSRGQRCERCQKKTKWLQVHHLTYERIFKEEPCDLQLLCAGCHKKEHGIGTNKKFNVSKAKKKLGLDKAKKKIKDPNKVAAGKKSHRIRKERFTAKNPVEKVLRQHKNGKYKTLMAFNTAYNCAIKRCKRFGVPYVHLITNI